MQILKSIWNQFSSMKFAIIVLLILAILSLLALFLGEFYPVRAGGPGWQDAWREHLGWSQPVFNLFLFFELHDPFRSWWYQILLAALVISLFTCIIDKLPVALRAMKTNAPRSGNDLKSNKNAIISPTEAATGKIKSTLPKLFSYREEQAENEWRVSGLRNRIGYLGPILTHAGLLCLAVGGLLASALGFKTTVGGYPGDLLTDPGFDFAVRVDTFQIEYYPPGLGQYVLVDDRFIGRIVKRAGADKFVLESRSHNNQMVHTEVEASRVKNQFDIEMDRGNIQDYITQATVLENDQAVKSFQIEVNKPLRHKGFRFYQTSFDYQEPQVAARIDSAWVEIQSAVNEAVLDTIMIPLGVPYPLPDGSELRMARFLPDFKMVESIPTSASARLRNPAVLLEVSTGGEKHYHQWSFLRNPFLHASPDAKYKFQVLDIFGFQADEAYKTILVVQKTPGYSLIWIGFVLATIGLILAFYLIPQRIWIAVSGSDGGVREIVFTGVSSKNPDLFHRKLEAWAARIKHL